jgi:hypothetical protein
MPEMTAEQELEHLTMRILEARGRIDGGPFSEEATGALKRIENVVAIVQAALEIFPGSSIKGLDALIVPISAAERLAWYGPEKPTGDDGNLAVATI